MRHIRLMVTNPPYLRAGDISGLGSEVADHDPRIALDGGSDGLSAYRQISRPHRDSCRPAAYCCLRSATVRRMRWLAHAGSRVEAAERRHRYSPRFAAASKGCSPSSTAGKHGTRGNYAVGSEILLEIGQQTATFLIGKTPKSHTHGALSDGQVRADASSVSTEVAWQGSVLRQRLPREAAGVCEIGCRSVLEIGLDAIRGSNGNSIWNARA